jgi:hypothetical protein
MMEKLAHAGKGGGGVHHICHHVQSCGECSCRGGRYALPISTLPFIVICSKGLKQLQEQLQLVNAVKVSAANLHVCQYGAKSSGFFTSGMPLRISDSYTFISDKLHL